MFVCVFVVLSAIGNIYVPVSVDMLLEDNGEGSSRKEGRHVKVVVTLDEDAKWKEVRNFLHFQLTRNYNGYQKNVCLLPYLSLISDLMMSSSSYFIGA